MTEQLLVTNNIQDVRLDSETGIYTLHYPNNIVIQATAKQLTKQ